MSRYVVHRKKDRYDVAVDRSSTWGNAWTHIADRHTLATYIVATRDEAIACHRAWFLAPEQKALRAQARTLLRGKVLGCWCAPLTCHADVLAEVANGSEDEPLVAGSTEAGCTCDEAEGPLPATYACETCKQQTTPPLPPTTRCW